MTDLETIHRAPERYFRNCDRQQKKIRNCKMIFTKITTNKNHKLPKGKEN